MIGTGKYISEQLGTFAILFLKHWGETHRRELIQHEQGDKRIVDFRLLGGTDD
jgi:hypothetical protein